MRGAYEQSSLAVDRDSVSSPAEATMKIKALLDEHTRTRADLEKMRRGE